ncbi:MAG: acetolactate decarboxylase [Desulfovibrio sp.]|nr:MAG: acetolactate decarboxylase [Desulfovibrio sp.]
MPKTLRCLILTMLLCLPALPGAALEPFREPEVLYQVSTLQALLDGLYDGQMTFQELAVHGDMGLGTFDKLDGEMVAIGGKFYQVRIDGSVHEADPDMTTPFAQVTPFYPDIVVDISGVEGLDALKARIDAALPSRNQFYAIIMTGEFGSMKTRSVPPQERPYPVLTEVVKDQAVFEFSDVSGVVVGFYSPDYAQSVGVPGYHLHFLTDDRSAGGHILDLAVTDATLELDATPTMTVTVPETGEFQEHDFTHSDSSTDGVER